MVIDEKLIKQYWPNCNTFKVDCFSFLLTTESKTIRTKKYYVSNYIFKSLDEYYKKFYYKLNGEGIFVFNESIFTKNQIEDTYNYYLNYFDIG